MDYSTERYVKLYVRDTPTWKAWRWEARAVWPLLMRKLDKAGRVDFSPRMSAAQAVSLLVDVPIMVVESAILDLEDTETIVTGPGWLEAPNFLAGQSAAQTPATRQAASRDRKAANNGVTGCHAASQGVTLSELSKPADLSQEQTAREPARGVSPPVEPKPKGKPRKPRVDYPDGLEEHFLAELQRACRDFRGRQDAGPRKVTDGMRDELRKLYAAEEPTPAELTRAISRRLELNREGDKYGDLTWEHLCRPASFRRYRDAMPTGPNGKPPGDDEPPDWMLE